MAEEETREYRYESESGEVATLTLSADEDPREWRLFVSAARGGRRVPFVRVNLPEEVRTKLFKRIRKAIELFKIGDINTLD